MSGLRSRRGVFLACAVAVTVLAGVARWQYGAPRTVLLDNDSASYISRALEISEGGSVFDVFVLPGYPLWIAACGEMLGDYVAGARLASVLSGTLLSLLVLLLGSRIYGRRVGVLAGLMVALNVALLDVSASELSESTYMFALTLAVAATLVAANRESLSWVTIATYLAAGLAYGVAYCVRPEAVFYLGLMPAALVLVRGVRVIRNGEPFGPAVRALAPRLCAFVVGGLLLLAPSVWFIHSKTGAWTINGRTIWAALIYSSEDKGPLERERILRGLSDDHHFTHLEAAASEVSMLGSFAENPAYKVRQMLENWWKTARLLPRVMPKAWILLCGLGLLALAWRHRLSESDLLLATALVPWVIVYPLYEIDFENLAPVVPILSLWSAVGIVSLIELAQRYLPTSGLLRAQGIGGAAVASVLLLATLGAGIKPELRAFTHRTDRWRNLEDDPANRAAGEWIRAHEPEAHRIVARKQFVGAYAGIPTITLPYATYPHLLEFIRYRDVSLLVMDERYKELRPELAFLFDPEPVTPGLERVFTTHNRFGEQLIVYRVVRTGLASQRDADESVAPAFSASADLVTAHSPTPSPFTCSTSNSIPPQRTRSPTCGGRPSSASTRPLTVSTSSCSSGQPIASASSSSRTVPAVRCVPSAAT